MGDSGKKLFYRASTFQIRDVFDVAAVFHCYSKELLRNVDILRNKLDILQSRLDIIRSRYEKEAIGDSTPKRCF